MQNFLVHVYWDVKLEIVWDTVVVDLPKLIATLDALFPRDASSGKQA